MHTWYNTRLVFFDMIFFFFENLGNQSKCWKKNRKLLQQKRTNRINKCAHKFWEFKTNRHTNIFYVIMLHNCVTYGQRKAWTGKVYFLAVHSASKRCFGVAGCQPHWPLFLRSIAFSVILSNIMSISIPTSMILPLIFFPEMD